MARPILLAERLQAELFGEEARCSRCGDPLVAGERCECIRERCLSRAEMARHEQAVEDGVPF